LKLAMAAAAAAGACPHAVLSRGLVLQLQQERRRWPMLMQVLPQ
jgi:hypothetical protein